MRSAFRVFAWLLVLSGLVVFAGDFWSYLATDLFALRPLGEVWAAIDRDSLAILQPAIERHVWAPLWHDVIFPALLLPAAPVLLALGLLLILVTRRRPSTARRRSSGR